MSESFGNGVTRTLSALQRQFIQIIAQDDKPPLDNEVNFIGQIAESALRQNIKVNIPSGFFTDPTRSLGDFQTNVSWSNYLVLGDPQSGEVEPVVWASVNGWIIPVSGTVTSLEDDVKNLIRLYPPPASDSRIDFVFLEVWQALVSPNPSTTNKPESSKIWKYGNVEFGGTNIDDDIEDPTVGYETTKRVQLQYRLRVFGQGEGLGSSLSLDVYPDGLDDPSIYGQGTATSPVSGFAYTNMREALGDASLWRAGNGDPDNALGTIDGYSYAIPVCAVFRRNTSTFTAISSAGNPNQNGAIDRNPSAKLLSNPREGAKALSIPTLNTEVIPGFVGDILVDNLVDSGLDDPNLNLSSTFIKIGDEILDISAVNAAVSPGTITVTARGRNATQDSRHESGASVEIFNSRPDGLFADQVAETDILDMRKSVNFGDWDYSRLLAHNLSSLIRGNLRSSYKQSGTGDTQGVYVIEADYLDADGSTAVPNFTEALDGPDGIRTIFSDSAAVQTDVTVLCDNDASLVGGFTTDNFDTNVAWCPGADFKPSGFVNNLGVSGSFTNGSVFFFHIGGDSGSEGARATFRDGTTRAVRFVSPAEYWKSSSSDPTLGKQHAITAKFINEQGHLPKAPGASFPVEEPGPYFSTQESGFTTPFIALGGVLHPSLTINSINSDPASGSPSLVSGPNGPEIDLGLDFDAPGGFYSLDSFGRFESNPDSVTTPLLRGQRTLYDMITNGGRDATGASSEVFIVLWGDVANKENNGAFRVIGAGTVGYTKKNASNSTSVRVEPLTPGVVDFVIAPGQTLTAQIRSQITNSEDGEGFASGNSALAVVLTDIKGESSPFWSASNLGPLSFAEEVPSKLLFNFTLQYHPGRGGTARVASEIHRISGVNLGSEYLNQADGAVDPAFPGETGTPSNETFYPQDQIQVWNRLPTLGLSENSFPKAPSFGGSVVAFSEQDRENEVFVDPGSKTVVLRPFKDRNMTLDARTTLASPSLVGDLNYPLGNPKDPAGIWTSNLTLGYSLPSEFMPKFGRQDIPPFTDITGNGTGRFMGGVNHLFTDSVDPTEPQFNIIGGQNNTSGGNLVLPLYFQTGSTSGVGFTEAGTIVGPNTPAIQARLTTEIGSLTVPAQEITQRLRNVQSSDLGSGLKGIQLPPFFGIARVYGVYDRDDYVAKGGATFEPNRATVAADPATNLLKTDSSAQTLFILQDGAEDYTESSGDHTYIIPENAIDITKSPYYSAGTKDTFEAFEYVVECSVFGFSRGWINENNYVLARRSTGQGTSINDNSQGELEFVRMTIPTAATLNDEFYVLYSRVPYQGDPYMTRNGSTRTVSDYENRYGQISNANAALLSESIQQLDSDGNPLVETPNARPLQILASTGFWTTLGTGKVGGDFYPGTILDTGHVESTPESSTRVPNSASEPDWRVVPRTYSEGQKNNPNRASLSLQIKGDLTTLFGAFVNIFPQGQQGYSFVGVNGVPADDSQFDVSGTPSDIAASLANSINLNIARGRIVTAVALGDQVRIQADLAGSEGNTIFVQFQNAETGTPGEDDAIVILEVAPGLSRTPTIAPLSGGVDVTVNAGSGLSQISLTGSTERLPLGILVQDSDFIGEDPLNDGASSFRIFPLGINPVQNVLPLTTGGEEFTRFFAEPGQLVAMSDGGILKYQAYDESTAPTGSRAFRLYRGGGSAFVLSGKNPGGPLDWTTGGFPASSEPVLKGAILVGTALLVRNFSEKAFATENQTTQGDEIQMLVLTNAIFGNGLSQNEGIILDGILSPTGYGEGYAASDRYRLDARPMYHGHSRTAPDPDNIQPAIFPGNDDD